LRKNASWALLNRSSISISLKAEKSFSFSPVAGLIGVIGIYQSNASFPDRDPGAYANPPQRIRPHRRTTRVRYSINASLLESKRDRANRKAIARLARAALRE